MGKFLRRLLIWIGIPLLLLAIVTWQLPADIGLRAAADRGVPIAYTDAEGSVWKGQASQFRWRGVPLGTVNWALQGPGPLPSNESRWALRGESADYRMQADLTLRGAEVARLENVNGQFPAHWVDLSEVAPFLVLIGRFDADIDFIEFGDGVPQRASGTIFWNGAGISGLVQEKLGRIELKMEPAADGTAIEFQSTQRSGLMVKGEGQAANNQWFLNLEIRATPSRRATLEELAEHGTRRGDSVFFEWSGRLVPQG